jgi:hypothetical protein
MAADCRVILPKMKECPEPSEAGGYTKQNSLLSFLRDW